MLGPTRVVPCTNSGRQVGGQVVVNISRCAPHLELWLDQLNNLLPVQTKIDCYREVEV